MMGSLTRTHRPLSSQCVGEVESVAARVAEGERDHQSMRRETACRHGWQRDNGCMHADMHVIDGTSQSGYVSSVFYAALISQSVSSRCLCHCLSVCLSVKS
uniref:Uncharacterized protein n=1 Tax=Vitrella brassicaformis TaxID=1169539 RepID=A0A6U4C3L4_9ALVE|mmetsp:Transcript_26578/g.66073  ORF Transcript_26578/g.66073 Transcript_26578/m.66073 type:complete len:101 (+) Transcript_26578:917-1219(+)